MRNSRSPEPDELAAQGFDRSDLEGDAIGPVADEIPWLRPFGADLPGPVLAEASRPGDSAGAVRQARELIRLGRGLDALRLLQATLGEPTGGIDPEARPLLARLLDEQGETEAALAELEQALEESREPYPVLVQRAAMLARAGRVAEGEKELRRAIRLEPGRPAAHAELGALLRRRGLPAEAAGALEEALRFRPDDPELLFQLGEAVEATGDLDRAMASLMRAAALAPRDPRPLKLMGRMLDRLGRTEEAMAMHRRAREATLT